MRFKWKRENIEKLILSVQQHPCLYSVKSVEYLDRLKKTLAFKNILRELSKNDSALTLEEIKRKWRILRNQFMREERLVKNSKKNGAGINYIYVPKLWCFEQMRFLQSHITRATIDNTKSETNKMPSSSDEVSFTEEHPRKRKKVFNSEKSNMAEFYIDVKSEPQDYPMNNIQQQQQQICLNSNLAEGSSFVIKSANRDYFKINLVEEVSVDIKNEPPDYVEQVSIDVNNEKPTCSKSNMEKEVYNESATYARNDMENETVNNISNEPPRCSKKKKTFNLDERIERVKDLLIKRLEEKSDYDWLGKQVVFELNAIKNKKIQRDTAWKIQTILREASIEDTKNSKCPSNQLSSESQLETQSSFASSSKEQSMCSFSSPSLSTPALPATHSLTPVYPSAPLKIISVNSYNTNTSYLPTHDITLDSIKTEEYQHL